MLFKVEGVDGWQWHDRMGSVRETDKANVRTGTVQWWVSSGGPEGQTRLVTVVIAPRSVAHVAHSVGSFVARDPTCTCIVRLTC
ncbi:hypothetical protein ACRE_084460 [Hapsidospora chrysogenum ATCC 11550]|uniref:Uncharacterized protein n=1 Tax=Hapsidospora chrysogenum (strain ATCC 11550 / CBS 779.69 / DSM 880 / IAM 14645 / JCM 23072 / IMI 49137) TaxID=857340 RepID=A0A086SUR9_HAPC1|nr:hypothetical protein ACRE_084460 [Hapsidospora chrysogenum ATCC 11550]